MLGFGARGGLAIGAVPDFGSLGNAAFQALLADPFAQRRFLVELAPLNVTTASVANLYYSTHGFQTAALDNPARQPYDARVNVALNVSRSLVNGGRLGGVIPLTAGEIVLNNADGSLDTYVSSNYSWDGRPIVVRMGGEGFAYSDYQIVYKGTLDQIEYDRQTVRLQARDFTHKLQKPVQPNRYLGTGGQEGGADLEGKPKPLVFGEVFNITPPLVNAAGLIYQLHDRSLSSVVVVRDKGVALTRVFVVGSLTTGRYLVSTGTSGTYLTLGANPDGTITADVWGDDSGSGYVNTTADIVQRIATTQASLSTGDLDLGSFAGVNTDRPSPVGIYIGPNEPRTALDVIEELMTGVHGWATFDRYGLMQLGVLSVTSGADDATYSSTQILDIERRSLMRPVDQAKVGYRKNFTIQTGGELATSVGASAKSEYANEFRFKTLIASTITSTHLIPGDPIVINGLFASATAASALASTVINIYATARDLYRTKVKENVVQLNLGKKVTLTLGRYGLNAGRQFRIVGMEEDLAFNDTYITLYG